MKSHHLGLCGLCVLVAAIVVVGALAFGVPASSLWILALVAVCPLMMIVMMRGSPVGAATTPGNRRTTSMTHRSVGRRQRRPEAAACRRRVPR